ncbi:MAG: hypothetical protein KKD01_15940 [Proteobacteria bacterium]|nr:hypothetical protein [Pseudomonadota bacterium]MBU1140284.1 hypothetical protein [Pseudomonadota bacterium]MBU1234074.1 hypothetical protein [Pseudomonadota bacterium]MBU1418192.1 hypothetical protein [Pseudomonadota bacterium]MBU1456216.1 hypothetical protein [Pseudomonadota bacterium]
MEDKKNIIKKADTERVAILRSLPQEIKQTLTGEEAAAFINNEPLSEVLYEKLKNYLVPIDD